MEPKAERQEVITHVPRERLDEVATSFRRAGAYKVERRKEPDGYFRVTAFFREDPDHQITDWGEDDS